MTMVNEVAPASSTPQPADDKEPVHLLHVSGRPPPGGGTCRCIACGLVFQSRNVTWTTSRVQHDANSFSGKFKSCNISEED